MLPRLIGTRIPKFDRPVFGEHLHNVDDKRIRGPVAATDHVARPRTGQLDAVFRELVGMEKIVPVRADENFGSSLATAVEVVTAQLVCFAITPKPARGSRSTCRW